jgi:hypothetical protein
VRLEGLGQLKNPITSSGIEPATFRFVAYTEIKSLSAISVYKIQDTRYKIDFKTFSHSINIDPIPLKYEYIKRTGWKDLLQFEVGEILKHTSIPTNLHISSFYLFN